MIGKGKSIAHTANSVDYALEKKEAEVLDMKGIMAENGTDVQRQFQAISGENEKLKNEAISFVISPEPKDGKSLTDTQYKQITRDFLREMKLDNHQYIAVKHKDKEHTHLHLYVNRTNVDGKVYKDSFIGKKAQKSADTVATKHNLTRAKDVQLFKEQMTKDLRAEIHIKHKAVLKHKPTNFNAYKDLMKSSGVDIIPTINKAGKLQGFRVSFQGQSFKATEIHRTMSLSKMGVKTASLAKGMVNPILSIGSKIVGKTIENTIKHTRGKGRGIGF